MITQKMAYISIDALLSCEISSESYQLFSLSSEKSVKVTLNYLIFSKVLVPSLPPPGICLYPRD